MQAAPTITVVIGFTAFYFENSIFLLTLLLYLREQHSKILFGLVLPIQSYQDYKINITFSVIYNQYYK